MASTVEQMWRMARGWIEEGWQKGDVGVVDRLHSPDFVDHDPAGRPPNSEGFKQGIRRGLAGVRDL